ncbi:MAG: phospholipase D family protein [Thermoanaerobaculia bacterium]
MPLIYQSPVQANVVFEALSNAVSPATTAFRAAVAYVTREGARRLVDELAARVGSTWPAIPKMLVTCFDFGTTEPGALEYLRSSGFEVRIANLGADGAIRIMSNPSSFHPKVYLASDDVTVHAVIGSANLSRRALSVNSEAVTAVDLDPEHAKTIWDEIATNSVELTSDLLQAYVDVRPRQRVAPPPDEPPVPPPAPPGALPEFRAVIEAGGVNPAEYLAFWVEVGGPSGGSGNQLELPRRAQRFFGYDFDDYDDKHHVVGEPVLTTATGAWSRRLTWHGNNMMERINLPTTAQSGMVYGHQVVLFQRSGASFEITVAAPGSARAERWREESAAAGTLYRFSGGSNRLCGLI